jgi:hypothetical protein
MRVYVSGMLERAVCFRRKRVEVVPDEEDEIHVRVCGDSCISTHVSLVKDA